jgi:dissimilatory sulfite reductase (desulfoviridin) alpha/beta subunit
VLLRAAFEQAKMDYMRCVGGGQCTRACVELR